MLRNGSAEIFSAIEKYRIDTSEENKNAIIKLVKAGVDLTVINEDKYTPLQELRNLKLWDCIDAIVVWRDDDNKNKAKYGGLLLDAIGQNRLETTRKLINAKAQLSWIQQGSKNTCLHEAVRINNPGIITLLITHGADRHAVNKAGQTPLVLACMMGHWECADLLTSTKKNEFANKVLAGLAFNQAVKAGKIKIAEYLYQAKASIDQVTLPGRLSAMHLAVQENNIYSVKFLINHVAYQYTVNDDNETPVEMATRLGHWDCAQTLIEAKNAELKTNEVVIAYHYGAALIHSIKAGNYTITKLLLEHHAPVNKNNSDFGNIALYWAVKGNHTDIVKLLVNFGANPNYKDKQGKTTFHLVKELNHYACCKALIKDDNDLHSLDTYAIETKKDILFETMKENGIFAADLPNKLNEIAKYHNAILKNDLAEVTAIRDAMRSQSSQSTHASLFTTQSTFIDGFRIMCSTINSLLNYPYNLIPINDLNIIINMQRQGNETADRVMSIAFEKQEINLYIAKLNLWLDQLKTRINQTTFKIKNIFGLWMEGVPKHIGLLNNILEKYNPAKTSDDIINIFSITINLLGSIRPSEDRHPDTDIFYSERIKEYKSINFTSTNAIYVDDSSYQSLQATLEIPSSPYSYVPANQSMNIPDSVLPKISQVNMFTEQPKRDGVVTQEKSNEQYVSTPTPM